MDKKPLLEEAMKSVRFKTGAGKVPVNCAMEIESRLSGLDNNMVK